MIGVKYQQCRQFQFVPHLPEELEELEEEERDPLDEPLDEEPLLESLFPPRFFFLSAAVASFAFVRSRLLRLDAIFERNYANF